MKGLFLFCAVSTLVLGPTKPAIQWEKGVPSLGKMRPEREAGYSLPFGV
jgi:hypothetical protein